MEILSIKRSEITKELLIDKERTNTITKKITKTKKID